MNAPPCHGWANTPTFIPIVEAPTKSASASEPQLFHCPGTSLEQPLSARQVRVSSEYTSLKALLQECAGGSISRENYLAMQKKIATFIQELDDIDIWYSKTNNPLLEQIDCLRALLTESFEARGDSKNILRVLDDISGKLLLNLSFESEPILNILIKAGFLPSDKIMEKAIEHNVSYLPLDIIKLYYEKSPELFAEMSKGLKLLAVGDGEIFQWWSNEKKKIIGEDGFNDSFRKVFWQQFPLFIKSPRLSGLRAR